MVNVDIAELKAGKNVVINRAEFTVNCGEIVAIMGPSGSGKSTLINAICNLNKDYQGNITINDNMISEMTNNQMRKLFKADVCLIMQDNGLVLNETVKQNIKYIPSIRHKYNMKSIEQVLKGVGLPIEILNQKVANLSGGEQQRVAIAKAILKKSKLLICDEPTGNLDEDNAQQVYEIFREIANNGVAIIIVSHDMHITTYADKLFRLENKQLVMK